MSFRKRRNPFDDEPEAPRSAKQIKNDLPHIYEKTLNKLFEGGRVAEALGGSSGYPYFGRDSEVEFQPVTDARCFVCTVVKPCVTCSYCTRFSCLTCVASCDLCKEVFCSFCTTKNYSERFEKTLCFACHELTELSTHVLAEPMVTSSSTSGTYLPPRSQSTIPVSPGGSTTDSSLPFSSSFPSSPHSTVMSRSFPGSVGTSSPLAHYYSHSSNNSSQVTSSTSTMGGCSPVGSGSGFAESGSGSGGFREQSPGTSPRVALGSQFGGVPSSFHSSPPPTGHGTGFTPIHSSPQSSSPSTHFRGLGLSGSGSVASGDRRGGGGGGGPEGLGLHSDRELNVTQKRRKCT